MQNRTDLPIAGRKALDATEDRNLPAASCGWIEVMLPKSNPRAKF
jgi:hypothetical protein